MVIRHNSYHPPAQVCGLQINSIWRQHFLVILDPARHNFSINLVMIIMITVYYFYLFLYIKLISMLLQTLGLLSFIKALELLGCMTCALVTLALELLGCRWTLDGAFIPLVLFLNVDICSWLLSQPRIQFKSKLRVVK